MDGNVGKGVGAARNLRTEGEHAGVAGGEPFLE